MNTVKLATFTSVVGLLFSPAVYAIVHAGADVDTKILIGQPGYVHEVIQDYHEFVIYTEANAHSWLPNPANWAAQAEAHAQRFHLDLPWPYPDIQWTSCWTHNQLRDGYNPKSASSKASAWGCWYIIDGPAGQTTELRSRIPRSGSVAYDPPPADIPPQGMYADSFFDIFTDVNVRVNPPGGTSSDLLVVKAKLGGPTAATPGLTFTDGAWAAAFFDVADTIGPGGQPRKMAAVRDDILSPQSVSLPTNTPFYMDWGLTVETPEVYVEGELTYAVGSAGAFAVQIELVDQTSGQYELRAIADPAVVTGRIVPQGYLGDNETVALKVRFAPAGGHAMDYPVVLAADGSFAVRNVPLDNYTVTIHGGCWLAARLDNVSVAASPTDLGTITLKAGDSNGDNLVSFEDFSILQNNYGQSGAAGAGPLSVALAVNGSGCGLLGIALVTLAGLSLYVSRLRNQG